MRRPHRGLRYGPAILPTACGMAKNRPAQAIEYFAAQGVAVKEFSEDSPLTVPLLPPGSACLTPADRSTRETCPRIPTSSAACWKSTLSRTSAHAAARADRLAVARLKIGRLDPPVRSGRRPGGRHCMPPIPRAWYKPAARAGSKTTTAARTRAAGPRPRLKAERGLHRKPMLMRYPTPVVLLFPMPHSTPSSLDREVAAVDPGTGAAATSAQDGQYALPNRH